MSSKRRVRWRQCGRKVRHATLNEAIDKALRLRRKFGKMHAYRCKFCGGYHVGH